MLDADGRGRTRAHVHHVISGLDGHAVQGGQPQRRFSAERRRAIIDNIEGERSGSAWRTLKGSTPKRRRT